MIGMRNRILMVALATAGMTVGYATPAAAQATRTWVSGVGDDVNPCSRTAPCKTFAGAISKTAAGGEINCLDPGGFGAVTIIKSMTIACQYTEGGALAGGNGVVFNMPATTDVGFLRGLDIFGVNPPTNGVRIINNGSVHIEDCVIRRFNAAGSFGISFQPSGAMKLFISNTTVANNGNAAAGSGGGILIQPTGAGGSAKVEMINVRVVDNAGVAGVRVETTGNTSAAGTFVTARWSQFSGNSIGFSAVHPAGNSGIGVLINESMFNHNTTFGVAASGTGTATIRLGNSVINDNGTAILNSGGGSVRSYGNNQVDGNTNPSSFIAGGAVES